MPAHGFRPDLPPGFASLLAPDGLDPFAYALAEAVRLEAGTLVTGRRPDLLEAAVVLAPEEPLRSARLAFLPCMVALAEAVGAVAPPEKPVSIAAPDGLLFDGARLGGGRLGWPQNAAEDAEPDWLVFGATLIRSKARAGDPGLTPDSTSMEEEGFASGSDLPFIEAFARYLLRAFDGWEEGGAQTVAEAYRTRLACRDVDAGVGAEDRLALALRTPSWLDAETGRPRL